MHNYKKLYYNLFEFSIFYIFIVIVLVMTCVFLLTCLSLWLVGNIFANVSVLYSWWVGRGLSVGRAGWPPKVDDEIPVLSSTFCV